MEDKFLVFKSIALAIGVIAVGLLGGACGLSINQVISLVAFTLSILGTLLFWEFRLSFAFLGTTLVLFTGTVKMEDFLRLSSMEIILFLVGMMIIVGFLKEIGVFTWLLGRALIMKQLSAKRFMVSLVFVSALLACVVDEVTSILILITIIFELCDYFEVNPIPFILASVLATNIGSAGTVIGNPIGLLIAAKAHLTFEDFLRYSFPLAMVSLVLLCGLFLVIFRKELRELEEKMKRLGPNEFLVRLLSVPPEKNIRIGLIIFGVTLLLIALHHRLELLLKLGTNTILLIVPLFSSAIIMIWRRHRARIYIERDVEWWTLLFFLFLFAQAGILAENGIAEIFAGKLFALVSGSKPLLVTTVLFSSALISSVLDNVVVVVGFIPILHNLKDIVQAETVLWWALLIGACFGGNMTVIGSTANIIALGALEKQRKTSIGFFYWLKIGLVVGLATLGFAWCALLFLPFYR